MNVVDFCIVLTSFVFIISHRRMSFLWYLMITVGIFFGYTLGIALAPGIVSHISSDRGKGFTTLTLCFTLAFLLGMAGLYFGNKLRMTVLPSRLYKTDRLLALPYKLLAIFIGIALISQTLIYVPLLGLQYVAQGSSILMFIDKITPETSLSRRAANIAPNQFTNLKLTNVPDLLAHSNIAGSDEHRKMIGSLAASVVKISGNNCVGSGYGSGFVAGPGYVVTNAHVVLGANSLQIVTEDGSFPATPILIDKELDVAVIYSKFMKTSKPLAISSTKAPPGVEGFILGYPGGSELRILKSSTSPQSGAPSDPVITKLTPFNTITMDAGLGPGSSGGPIINSEGVVIGMTAGGDGSKTIAVSSDVVSKLFDKALRKRLPTRTGFCAIPEKFIY